MAQNQPNLMDAAIRYIECIVGTRYADDKFMEDITRKFFEATGNPNSVDYNWYPKAASKTRGYEYQTKLGFFRIDNLLIQPSLLVSTVLPDLTTEYGFNSFNRGVKMTAETMFNKKLQEIAAKSHVLDTLYFCRYFISLLT